MKQAFAVLITAIIFFGIGSATAATSPVSTESLATLSSALLCSEVSDKASEDSDKAKGPKKKKKGANDEEPECE